MTIDSKHATEALHEIDVVVRAVRQSRVYNLASLLAILWGVLTFGGYVNSYFNPRYAAYGWTAVYIIGIAGWIAISPFGQARFGVRTFDVRMFAAFCLFFAFGFWICWLGHFMPRQLSAFWPSYFMLAYTLMGLWIGWAFVVIGLGITALTMIGYFFVGAPFDLWMAVVNGGGLVLGGLWMRRN